MKLSMIPLPSDYVPGPYDVICGRTRDCSNSVGNKQFMKIIQKHLHRYKKSVSRMEKSVIILDVISCVEKNCYGGGFVRYDPLMKRYYLVTEKEAREKTSKAFRDAVAGTSMPVKRSKYMRVSAKEKGRPSCFKADKDFANKMQSSREHTMPELMRNTNREHEMSEYEPRPIRECTPSEQSHETHDHHGNDELDVLFSENEGPFQSDYFRCRGSIIEGGFFSLSGTTPVPLDFNILPSNSLYKTASFDPFTFFKNQTEIDKDIKDLAKTIREQEFFQEWATDGYNNPFEPRPI